MVDPLVVAWGGGAGLELVETLLGQIGTGPWFAVGTNSSAATLLGQIGFDGSTVPSVAETGVAEECGTDTNGAVSSLVCTATGPLGLGLIAVYSFLIAAVLPAPSEVVLLAPLSLGLPGWATLGLIVVVSALGKTVGSLVVFRVGQEAKEYGPIVRVLERSRFDLLERTEQVTVGLTERWGFVGLAGVLAIPGFPDTISIYAFTLLEDDLGKFAGATFVGSAGRLLITLAVVGGGLAIL